MIEGLLSGFIGLLKISNVGYAFFGCLLGTFVGVLPGLGTSQTCAILFPLTTYLSPTAGIIMLAGIYYGAQYGGSTTSILINVPGEATSVMTCIDGFAMTRQGRAGEALAISAIGSFIAGTFGVIALTFVAFPLAQLALEFGPPEYFSLIVFSLTAMLSLSTTSFLKGIISGIFGMFVATIGLDPQSGSQRLTLGIVTISGGLDMSAIIVGLFGIAEVFLNAETGVSKLFEGRIRSLIPRGNELVRGLYASLRGTLLGFVLGLLPGMIPAVTTFLSYDFEKRVSKHPEKFGSGMIEGVAGPEACNNATAMAGFLPLFSLGIPTTASLAIMLATLMVHGFHPGPLLFAEHPDFVWTVIASMYLGNVILLVLNLPLLGVWAKLSLVPFRILGPMILGLAMMGAYAVRSSMFDVWIALLFGLIGFVMKKAGWPVPPLILGFILGPILEQSFRQTLQLSSGSLWILAKRPIPAILLVFTVLLVVLTPRLTRKQKKPITQAIEDSDI